MQRGGPQQQQPQQQPQQQLQRPPMPADGISPTQASSSHAQQFANASKLIRLREFDEADDLDRFWSEQFKIFDEIASNSEMTENEINTALQDKASESSNKYCELTIGALYGILTDARKASHYFRYLGFFTRDSFAFCIGQLQKLATERFHKLHDEPRAQFLWLMSELISSNVNDTDVLSILLLRQISTCDFSPRNLAVVSAMLNIFSTNTEWLYANKKLLSTAVYTYLRLSIDHGRPALANLRQQEIAFCVRVLREKLSDVLIVGRDLIRVLYELRHMPQIESVMNDLLLNNASEQSQLITSGTLIDVLSVPTPVRYLTNRTTYDMEKQLVFMMMEVKMGNQRRYQQWFAHRFLHPEAETIIIDLIRFICVVFHPPNQILASNFVPRWAMIGWLIMQAKNPAIVEAAKIALLYDWFFFDAKRDSIMNLEPAMLLMVHSIPKYPEITSSLLHTLLSFFADPDPAATPSQGSPALAFVTDLKINPDIVRDCIARAMAFVVEKGVVPNLNSIADSPRISVDLRRKLKHYFPRLTQQQQQHQQQQQQHPQSTLGIQISPNAAKSPPGSPGISGGSTLIGSPTNAAQQLLNHSHPHSEIPSPMQQQQHQHQPAMQASTSGVGVKRTHEQITSSGSSSTDKTSPTALADEQQLAPKRPKLVRKPPIDTAHQQQQQQQQHQQRDVSVKTEPNAKPTDNIVKKKKLLMRPKSDSTAATQQQQQQQQQQYATAADQQIPKYATTAERVAAMINSVPESLSMFEPHATELVKSINATLVATPTATTPQSSNTAALNATIQTARLRAMKSMQKLVEVFDTIESPAESLYNDLSLFICRVLAPEFNSARTDPKTHIAQCLVNKTVVDTFLESLFVRISNFRNSKQSSTAAAAAGATANSGPAAKVAGRAITQQKAKQNRSDKYSQLLRHATSFEPAFSYRSLCFCIKRDNSLLELIEDTLLASLDYREDILSNNKFLGTATETDNDQSQQTASATTTTTTKMAKRQSQFWFYEWLASSSVKMQLHTDLMRCAEENCSLLVVLLPILCDVYKTQLKGSALFIHSIVSNMQPHHLQEILCLSSAGRIELIGEENAVSLMEAIIRARNNNNNQQHQSTAAPIVSTTRTPLWGFYESISVWDIMLNELSFRSDEFDIFTFTSKFFELGLVQNPRQPISAASDSSAAVAAVPECRELLNKIHLLLKDYEPTYEMVKLMFFLSPLQYGLFASTMLYHWLKQGTPEVTRLLIKHTNKLLKEMYAHSNRYKLEWKDKADSVAINLLQIKRNEALSSEPDSDLFSNSEFVINVNRLKERGLIKNYLFSKIISSTTTATATTATTAVDNNTREMQTRRMQRQQQQQQQKQQQQNKKQQSKQRNDTKTRASKRRVIETDEDEDDHDDDNDEEEEEEPTNRKRKAAVKEEEMEDADEEEETEDTQDNDDAEETDESSAANEESHTADNDDDYAEESNDNDDEDDEMDDDEEDDDDDDDFDATAKERSKATAKSKKANQNSTKAKPTKSASQNAVSKKPIGSKQKEATAAKPSSAQSKKKSQSKQRDGSDSDFTMKDAGEGDDSDDSIDSADEHTTDETEKQQPTKKRTTKKESKKAEETAKVTTRKIGTRPATAATNNDNDSEDESPVNSNHGDDDNDDDDAGDSDEKANAAETEEDDEEDDNARNGDDDEKDDDNNDSSSPHNGSNSDEDDEEEAEAESEPVTKHRLPTSKSVTASTAKKPISTNNSSAPKAAAAVKQTKTVTSSSSTAAAIAATAAAKTDKSKRRIRLIDDL